ncbi:MAG: hypothetical protein U0805_11650 [Pirellulales bacterium]
MSSEPQPLRVVVASADVALLHEASWILEAVGYQVEASTDFEQDALWRRFSITDIVIVDGRGIEDPTGGVFSHDTERPLYKMFLYDPAKPADFAAWYAAGAHDALRAPISRGELLSRLRTAARFLEFERRLQSRSLRCVVVGMYSQRGLLRRLRKLAGSSDFMPGSHTFLMTAIDWYAGIRRKNGETAGRTLVNMTARAIKRAAGENAISAYLGNGRFATLLIGPSAAVAKAAADALARDFGSRESHHESVPRPTLTSAIVPWAEGADAESCLSAALETLRLAEQSGGDRVLVRGEYQREFEKWHDEMSTGNPFANVVAQDIMTPFAAVLSCEADERGLAQALKQSGIAIIPYVDREGRLVGVAAEATSGLETFVIYPRGSTGVTLAMPEAIAYDASFPEIYEAFSSRGCTTLIVTADERPLGYLTCDGFLSMIDPVNAESFSPTKGNVDDLQYLAVPATTGQVAIAPQC